MANLATSRAQLRRSVADATLRAQDAARGRHRRPDAPRQGAEGGHDLPALGRLAGDRGGDGGDRDPHEIAILDERGALSSERLHRRSNALAHAFAAMGIGPGDGIGIMCRNHRGFIEATLAAAKLGASALYLNTVFAGPQLAEVTRARGAKALVYDEEFAELCSSGVDDGGRPGSSAGPRRARSRRADARGADRRRRRGRPQPPPDKPRFVILTSGTTGTPKGAQRSSPDGALRGRRAARPDPLPQPRDDDDRRAALPLLGLLPLRREPADRRDDGPAPPLRPRGDAGGGRSDTRPTCSPSCR